MTIGLSLELGGYGHTESGRDGIGGMAAGKRIILTLRGRGEGLDATQLAVCTELLPTTSQDLMTVCLMSHIPYDTILWGVIDIVQRNSNLHHAEAGGQMTWIHCYLLHDILAQFFTELRQIVH